MEWESIFINRKADTKASLKMEKNKGMEYSKMIKETNIKVIGKMTACMAKVDYTMLGPTRFTKEPLYKTNAKEKGNIFIKMGTYLREVTYKTVKTEKG